MKRLGWALAIAVPVVAVLIATAPAAQPSDNEGPEYSEKSYDIRDLKDSDGGKSYDNAWPELAFFGRLGRSAQRQFEDGWPYAHEQGAPLFEDTRGIETMIHNLASPEDLESLRSDERDEWLLVVNGTDTLHRQIEAALGVLRAFVTARIRVEVRRLDSRPEETVLQRGR